MLTSDWRKSSACLQVRSICPLEDEHDETPTWIIAGDLRLHGDNACCQGSVLVHAALSPVPYPSYVVSAVIRCMYL